MEQALKKIIELDEVTERYKKQCDETKDKLKFEMDENLKLLNDELQYKISNYDKKTTAQKRNEAEDISKAIRETKNQELKKIKENYRNRKKMLVKEIFNLIIKDSG